MTYEVTAGRDEDGVTYECRVSSKQLKEPLHANVSLVVYCEWLGVVCARDKSFICNSTAVYCTLGQTLRDN